MIAAVVLAAGGARRFGRPKQVLEHGGRPLVETAVRAVLGGGCDPVFVVVGAHAEVVSRALADLSVQVVPNPGWEEGMASSIRLGVERVANEPRAEAVLLIPSDLPHASASVVCRLIEAARGRPGDVLRLAACAYAGTLGPPALFPRSQFGRLLRLSGDQGAKSILLEQAQHVAQVAWPEGEWDVDRPDDRRDGSNAL